MGFPATQVFERAGPIVDPMYHNSGELAASVIPGAVAHELLALTCTGDLSDRDGYDFEQIKSIAKIQVRFAVRARSRCISDGTLNVAVCDAFAHGWVRSAKL